MIYLAAAIWINVIVLMAWGIDYLWTRMVKPRYFNAALLPGTMVATLGRIVGLLITGAKVNNTALMSDDDQGAPQTDLQYEPKIPFFGPMLVGFIPLVAIGTAIYLLVMYLYEPLAQQLPVEKISAELPVSGAAFWDQLRHLIDLTEATYITLIKADYDNWQVCAAIYLMICLAIRSAPYRGNERGHFGAIATTAAIVALAGTVTTRPAELIEQSWPILVVTVGWLSLLLMGSLVARGIVAIVRGLAKGGG